MSKIDLSQTPQILYSCYFNRSREGEQFVPEHILNYQLSGTALMNDGEKDYFFKEGDLKFCKRNQLVKFVKQPPENGEFKSISIYLDQETLRNYSLEFGIVSERHDTENAIIKLKPDARYQSYIDSLMPYEFLDNTQNEALFSIKLKEAIMILLQSNPEMKDILFDFTEPGKIDLEAFMNKNFHFNVEMKRFAYLTGRSLATFKRDFQKIFQLSPSRWLIQKRLQEAYYLIKEKGKMPSEIYLDLGFEDFSHFSFAFKKTYGLSPSKI